MNEHEEKLQRDIEAGKILADESIDTSAYQTVFRALKKEPALRLPESFSSAVVQKLQRKNASGISEYFWLGFGFLLIVAALIVTFAYVDFKLSFGFLSAMSSYKGLFIFGVVFIVALNFLEKQILKSRGGDKKTAAL
jgi:hypothetical protein